MTYILLTFAATAILTPLLARFAPRLGLVDRPDNRKRHAGHIPLVGGVAIFISLCAIAALALPEVVVSPVLLFLGLLLVLLGVIDDMVDLRVLLRVIVQLSVAAAMVIFMDLRIENIGALFGGDPVVLDPVTSTFFTVLCVVGVINAINMIDGLDGLSGSILLVSFGVLAVLAIRAGSEQALFLGCICAALVGFLFYNARVFRDKAAVFLGDSGSMFLGLVLVWAFVELSHSEAPALTVVSTGWIFGLPLIETVVLMVTRIMDRKSPFQAGRDHLHHRLQDAGFSTNQTLGIMVAVHSVLAGVGFVFAGDAGSETVLFWLFVVVTVAYFVVMRNGRELLRTRVGQIKQP